MVPLVQVKGIRDGLLVMLGDGPWEEVHQAFLDYIDQQAGFLQGARLALDVGNRAMKAADLGQLRSEILERELGFWAIVSESPATVQNAQSLGLATRITQPHPELTVAKIDTELSEGDNAILVHRTLRSGFSLEHRGHIIVIGDINPGAEIIAGGDVVVWGHLRGMVHAGAQGNDEAVVCALDLDPVQLRIAGIIAITPKRRGKPQPEMAHLINDQVVAEPWMSKKQ